MISSGVNFRIPPIVFDNKAVCSRSPPAEAASNSAHDYGAIISPVNTMPSAYPRLTRRDEAVALNIGVALIIEGICFNRRWAFARGDMALKFRIQCLNHLFFTHISDIVSVVLMYPMVLIHTPTYPALMEETSTEYSPRCKNAQIRCKCRVLRSR